MKAIALSSISEITAGQSAPKSNEFSKAGIPFIRAGSLERLINGLEESKLELVDVETAKRRKLKLYPKGAILFAKSGMSATKGRIYMLKDAAYVVSHLAILNPKSSVHGEYLRLVLNQFPPSRLIKDPAYPAISLKEISNYKLPIPEEINDQKRIAQLLSKVEGLINDRIQSTRQLDELMQSIFLELFGNNLKDESNYTSITNICDFIDYRGKTPSRTETGIPFISAKCVRSGYFDETRLDFISEDTYKKRMTRGFPKANDVLFTTEGATFGFTCRVPRHYEKFSVGQRLISMICKDGNQPEALEFLLNNKHIQKKLASRLSGSSVLGIRSSELLKIELPVLPSDLQVKFSNIVEKTEVIKCRYQQNLDDLQNLYGTLSQKAFKGELDLSSVPLPEEKADIPDTLNSSGTEKVSLDKPRNTILSFSQVKDPSLNEIGLRKSQLSKWFQEWIEHYQKGNDLNINHFWQCIDFTTQDYLDDDDNPFEVGLSDYDHIKSELFGAIKSGKVEQTTDMIEIEVDGKPTIEPGNQILLKKLN